MTDIYHTIIIAEAGVNHNGQMDIAKKLIDVASAAGADFIKFQTFKADKLVTVKARKADYQKKLTDEDESQYDMIKKLELSREDHEELIRYCRIRRIKFLSSPFDLESIDLLDELGVELYKIPSGEITNFPYLKRIAEKGRPVILSTGMSNLLEIEDALNVLTDHGLSLDQITVLHANTEYPSPFEDVNLRAMLSIKNKFNVKIGYSDHTPGIEVPIAATALGAEVIEKHITLDKNLEGPDHKASLEPDELTAMVNAVRHIELALGNGTKRASKSEEKNLGIARKSIHAKIPIKVGDAFSADNLIAKRPGNGISPMRWNEIIGKKANRNFETDELIEI